MRLNNKSTIATLELIHDNDITPPHLQVRAFRMLRIGLLIWRKGYKHKHVDGEMQILAQNNTNKHKYLLQPSRTKKVTLDVNRNFV